MTELNQDFDAQLNRKDSLLNILNSLGVSITADKISSGVFAASSDINGIEFGIDKTTDKSYLQSRNFVSGSTGWQILSDGTAEFVSLTASGYIQVGGAATDVNAGIVTISGGKITANTITATQISSSYIYTNTLEAEQITAGTLTGRTVRTSAGATRVQMDGDGTYVNEITWYYGGSLNGRIYSSAGPLLNIINPQVGGGITIGTGDGLFTVFLSTAALFYKNISFTSTQTVDGVDISVFATNYNAHIAAASAHHSSTSSGIAIVPSNVNTAYVAVTSYIDTPFIYVGGNLSQSLYSYATNFATRIRLVNLGADPTTNEYKGQMFMNTWDNRARLYDGTNFRDICYYDERNAASPLPTFVSGLDELKKIKDPDETMNYNPDAFSDNFKLKIEGKIDKDRLDLKPIIGMLIKSQKELLQKVELLESKI